MAADAIRYEAGAARNPISTKLEELEGRFDTKLEEQEIRFKATLERVETGPATQLQKWPSSVEMRQRIRAAVLKLLEVERTL